MTLIIARVADGLPLADLPVTKSIQEPHGWRRGKDSDSSYLWKHTKNIPGFLLEKHVAEDDELVEVI